QETRTALTNGFGRFKFANLPTGNLYIVTIGHKRYNFKPNTLAFDLIADKEDVNFVGIDGN
ncbi:MAG TPA: hypothetical protein VEQ18_00695, partial [Candidatus Nitrosocosmicus sp.]|nr:hypothetical protein [Candidatus Nitrosocosmicus sp.]